jgi:hypothetical protein
MSENSQKQDLIINYKKGVPVYETNPSILDHESIKKRRSVRLGNEKKGFVIDGAGEVIAHGTAMFYEYEEVDNERFVKVFREGIKQTTGMSKSGMTIFDLVYVSVQDAPNKDEVKLSFYNASKKIQGLTERTYQRGLRELLDREFLFRSPEDGVFFINIRYLFNGDRLAFVKGYKRKETKSANQSVLK